MPRVALVTLCLVGCGGAAAAPATPGDESRAEEPAPAAHRCVVESWSHQVLAAETGRGATPREAHDDAASRLCADQTEECPGEHLLVIFNDRIDRDDSQAFQRGVIYELRRREYGTHEGTSERSREAACVAAVAEWESSRSPSGFGGLAGVNGLRWSDMFGARRPTTSAEMREALGTLEATSTVESETYECSVGARIAPIAWQNALDGDQGEACLASRPPELRGSRMSSVHCDPDNNCQTECYVLGAEQDLSAKGRADTSYRDACVDAVGRLCADGECRIELLEVDGISTERLGAHHFPRRPPP